MIIRCPNCQNRLDVPESPFPRHDIPCSVCGKKFFASGELGFPYGDIIDDDPAVEKIACPFCHQHYDLGTANPRHGLIGCMICSGVFSVPPPWELAPKKVTPAGGIRMVDPAADAAADDVLETDDSGLRELPPERDGGADDAGGDENAPEAADPPPPGNDDLAEKIARAKAAAELCKSTVGLK